MGNAWDRRLTAPGGPCRRLAVAERCAPVPVGLDAQLRQYSLGVDRLDPGMAADAGQRVAPWS